MYLDLKNEIVASESEGNDPKSIEEFENPSDLGVRSHRIVRHVGKPALGHGHRPYHGAVGNGGDGSNEGHSGYGVQVGELRQEHRGAREN